MNHLEFQLRALGDPRLASHAASALPAWLWSTDGTRILWANPAGAKLFGADNSAALAEKSFGPADQHRRQVAQLANRLPANGALRLERLRGFGAAFGMLATCGCARLDFADGNHGVLVTSLGANGRIMPLAERLQRLVEGINAPAAAFSRDGLLLGLSDAARSLPGLRDLSEDARDEALKEGRAERQIAAGHVTLQRVGSGADVGLIAFFSLPPCGGGSGCGVATDSVLVDPHPRPLPAGGRGEEAPALSVAAPAEFTLIDLVDEFAEHATETIAPTREYEASASSGEAPAEFALIDEPAPREPEQASIEPTIEEPAAEAVSEEAIAETIAETVAPASEEPPHEPSPYVEAVADEPVAPENTFEHEAVDEPPAQLPPWLEESAPVRTTPLRFMWQMDADSRFTLASDEFKSLIGARTSSRFGRLWSEIAKTFGLDPEGRVQKAFATHDTWSGIALNWPVDGGGDLPVELSGLPLFDRERNFVGYRGFGVCRDFEALARLAALRRDEFFHPPMPQPLSADIVPPEIDRKAPTSDVAPPELIAPIAAETSQPTDLEKPVETPNQLPQDTPPNVVPFRPAGEPKSPSLTPVENSAFNELARQLAERLEREHNAPAAPPPTEPEAPAAIVDPPPVCGDT